MKMKKMFATVAATAMLATSGMAMGSVAAGDTKVERIVWEHAGELSPAFGYEKNIGFAGMLSGRVGDYVIVGGGANFPKGGPLVGGPKQTYPDVYVLKLSNGSLVETDHIRMPFEIGYGASVTAPEGVYYIGGSTDPQGAKTISLISVDSAGKAKVTQVGAMPFAMQNCISVMDNGMLYVGLGKQDGKLSNKIYRYDLKTNKTEELAAFPGEAREQAVAQVLNGKLYVFSGGSNIAYTDGYAYDLAANSWSKAAPVGINGKGISLLGANSVKLNADEMLVIGGFNKAVYDNAVMKLGALKDKELAVFRSGYFGADPDEFNWNKEVLIYQAKTDSWRSIGRIPFYAPCGAGLVLKGDNIISVNGEIKPGVRSNNMYIGTFVAAKR